MSLEVDGSAAQGLTLPTDVGSLIHGLSAATLIATLNVPNNTLDQSFRTIYDESGGFPVGLYLQFNSSDELVIFHRDSGSTSVTLNGGTGIDDGNDRAIAYRINASNDRELLINGSQVASNTSTTLGGGTVTNHVVFNPNGANAPVDNTRLGMLAAFGFALSDAQIAAAASGQWVAEPLFRFKLEEAAGVVAVDQSNNGYDATGKTGTVLGAKLDIQTYDFVRLSSPNLTNPLSALYGYSGLGDTPVTGDVLVHDYYSSPSNIPVSFTPQGLPVFATIPTVTQTVSRWVVQADNTIGTAQNYVYSIEAAAIHAMMARQRRFKPILVR